MTLVYVTRRLPQEILSKLRTKNIKCITWDSNQPIPRKELIANIQEADGILCTLSDKIDNEIINAAPKLKVVATMSVGYDHVDVQALKRRGIRLGYTPNVLTDATAELTVSLVLSVSRRIFEAAKTVPSGNWGSWSPFWMCGVGVMNSTIGIVGLGRIGQAVARRLAAFGPTSILYSSTRGIPVSQLEKVPLLSTYNQGSPTSVVNMQTVTADPVPFDELLSRSDFVVVCCQLNEKTKLLFNDKTFSKMKPGALFVNTSRGGVVDQQALASALKRGLDRMNSNGSTSGDSPTKCSESWLAGAGLDVTTPEPLPVDSELLQLPNCVVLPHIGSATYNTRRTMVSLCVDNLITGLTEPNRKMPAEVQF